MSFPHKVSASKGALDLHQQGVLVWAVGQQKKYFYYIQLAAIIVFVKKEF